MAGSQTLRMRGGQLVAALALYFFTFAGSRAGANPITAITTVTTDRNAGPELLRHRG